MGIRAMMPMQNSLAQRLNGMQPPGQPVGEMQLLPAQPGPVGAPVQGTIARPGGSMPAPMRPGMPMQPMSPMQGAPGMPGQVPQGMQPTQIQQPPAAQNNIRMRLGMM